MDPVTHGPVPEVQAVEVLPSPLDMAAELNQVLDAASPTTQEPRWPAYVDLKGLVLHLLGRKSG